MVWTPGVRARGLSCALERETAQTARQGPKGRAKWQRMLDYIGEPEIAQKIRAAIAKVYAEGEHLTGDIRKVTGSSKPACSCAKFTDALIAAL